MGIQAAVFDTYGKSIFELQGFPVKFRIRGYKEVFTIFKFEVYNLFFAYFILFFLFNSILIETKKTSSSQRNVEKEKRSWRNQTIL